VGMNPIRHPLYRDARPEFLGRVFTGVYPLDNAERLYLWRMKRAIADFFRIDDRS